VRAHGPPLSSTAMTALLQHWFELILPLLAGWPRVFALMMTVPLFPKQGFAFLVRNGVAIALLLGVYPTLAVQLPPSTWDVIHWIGFAAKEAFIGFLLGFALGALMWVFQSLGDLIDNQVGLNNAAIFDPFSGHSGGPYSGFMMQFAITVFIALGGLQLLAGLLYESYTLWPPTSFTPKLGDGYKNLALKGLQHDGAWALTLVAPLIIVLVLAELAVGLVNRVAPQLNSFYFAMPIKGVLAILMLVALVSFWVDALRGAVNSLRDLLTPWDAALRSK
jgi:type III secretion protein T